MLFFIYTSFILKNISCVISFQEIYSIFFKPVFIDCVTNFFHHIMQKIKIMITCQHTA